MLDEPILERSEGFRLGGIVLDILLYFLIIVIWLPLLLLGIGVWAGLLLGDKELRLESEWEQ